jgi:GrpB-like predicted nucleotidyltransferase (UPF0157 family)
MEGEQPQTIALLAFRDALRADAGLRSQYAGLKDQLARQHPGNRNAYTNGKADFVEQVLQQAGVQQPPRDLLPE